jgi:signal transduction histidine kinase
VSSITSPRRFSLCLFRVIQEALHNVAKHTHAGIFRQMLLAQRQPR